MLFNSLVFALFLPLVGGLHALLPRSARWVLLLVASYVFYMWWAPAYGLLLFASTALDWYVGTRLPHAGTVGARRRWLSVSLAGNLGMLFTFKYFDLVNGTFASLAATLGVSWPIPDLGWPLPVGISFYTFQTLSYAIDVYRGHLPPEPSLPRFALFVSFFPQLVAGPIERATNLVPQLRDPAPIDARRIETGLRLAAWGMFKKVVVADRLGVYVDAVYADPRSYSGVALALAMLFFAYQVYCDFSGYSDVAIGVARMFGIDLMTNFDQPHGSRSMTEWWSRWHISLSTWFRDYLYIPMGGNRVSFARWSFHTFVVFLVSGLWHGATWTFAAWGLLHGALVVGDRATKPTREAFVAAIGLNRLPALRSAVAIGSTFVLWTFTLVPFRADGLGDAVWIVTHLHTGWSHVGELQAFLLLLARVRVDLPLFVWCLALMPVVEIVDHLRRDPEAHARWLRLPTAARWALDYLVVFAVIGCGYWSDTPFVYFQF